MMDMARPKPWFIAVPAKSKELLAFPGDFSPMEDYEVFQPVGVPNAHPREELTSEGSICGQVLYP